MTHTHTHTHTRRMDRMTTQMLERKHFVLAVRQNVIRMHNSFLCGLLHIISPHKQLLLVEPDVIVQPHIVGAVLQCQLCVCDSGLEIVEFVCGECKVVSGQCHV